MSSNNFSWPRWVLIFALFSYAMALVLFLKSNLGLKRHVTITDTKIGGVAILNGIKYPTPYFINQVRVGYVVNDPIDYLFLSSDDLQESLAGALIKLSACIMAGIFLWRFDFYEPFQHPYYKKLKVIGLLVTAALLQEFVKDLVSEFCVRDELHTSQYQYIGHSVNTLWFWSIIINTLLYMYGLAVKNKGELDLTI